MKKQLLLLAFSILFLQGQSQTCKEIVGYYPSWQWYDRGKLVNPASIQYDKYTILNYAFFNPKADGSIGIIDPWADKNLLLGPINWAVAPAGYDTGYDLGNTSYHQPNAKLSDYAHQHNVKLLVSVGGFTLSDHFPAIAANPTTRANFAHYCNLIVKLYNLDGIDIDWEYPGFVPHNGSPSDKQNCTLLFQQIRDSLDDIAPMMGRPLLLSGAFGASPTHMSDIDWAAMNPIVDIFNLMSYDYYGTWDPVTNHNAPLYASANATQPGFSCSESVNNLLAKNIPANKITMGIAFYGRTQMCTGTPNVYAQGNGQIDPNFAGDSGSPQYYNILAQNSNYDYHWDSVAHVPYLTGKNGHKGFVSFDDTSSIEEKAQFIVQKNLRGAIIWEITGDYIETFAGSGVIAGTPLLDKLNTTLCSGSVAIADAANSYFSIYPNPAHDVLYIQSPAPIPLEIWNIWGQKCLSATVYESLDIHHLPAGVYYAKSKTKGYKFIKQ